MKKLFAFMSIFLSITTGTYAETGSHNNQQVNSIQISCIANSMSAHDPLLSCTGITGTIKLSELLSKGNKIVMTGIYSFEERGKKENQKYFILQK